MNPQTSAPLWRRSSRCDGGACVEVALHDSVVLMRDSKDPASPVLRFSHAEWEAFVDGVGNGEFSPAH